jgi:hypothetical protein
MPRPKSHNLLPAFFKLMIRLPERTDLTTAASATAAGAAAAAPQDPLCCGWRRRAPWPLTQAVAAARSPPPAAEQLGTAEPRQVGCLRKLPAAPNTLCQYDDHARDRRRRGAGAARGQPRGGGATALAARAVPVQSST